jgi:hypothetical protein
LPEKKTEPRKTSTQEISTGLFFNYKGVDTTGVGDHRIQGDGESNLEKLI